MSKVTQGHFKGKVLENRYVLGTYHDPVTLFMLESRGTLGPGLTVKGHQGGACVQNNHQE